MRLCTLSCESSDSDRVAADRREVKRIGAETIDQSPDDGALCRAARDDEARSSHPCPDDRPRPPSASGVPVRGCAQAASGGPRTGDERVTGPDSGLQLPLASRLHTPPAFCPLSLATTCPVPSDSPSGVLSTSRAAPRPVAAEGATESDCLLRCGRLPRSPGFQLRIPPELQLSAPRDLLYTGNNIAERPLKSSRPVRGVCARAFRGRLTGAQPMSQYLGKTR